MTRIADMILVFDATDLTPAREVRVPLATTVTLLEGLRVDAFAVSMLPHGKYAYGKWADAHAGAEVIMALEVNQDGGYQVLFMMPESSAARVRVGEDREDRSVRATVSDLGQVVSMPAVPWLAGGPKGVA